MKSWGSWSSGFPVNEQLVMSVMSVLSRGFRGMEYGGSGESRWLFCWVSCVVHVAGENVNWEDGVDESVQSDVKSSESMWLGELPRVEGTKRSCSSLSILACDWRGASLVQGAAFGK
jgi:hypothetical protein